MISPHFGTPRGLGLCKAHWFASSSKTLIRVGLLGWPTLTAYAPPPPTWGGGHTLLEWVGPANSTLFVLHGNE